MEESLIIRMEEEEEEGRSRWVVIKEEIKRVSLIGGPMVGVLMTEYMLQVISTMMVGHLGELSLASSALAISIAGVTGFSLMVTPFFY